MGQLEKYGLYVLCLLIFLILGVTFMGSGEVAAKRRGDEPSVGDSRIDRKLPDGVLNARTDRNRPGGGGQENSGLLADILGPNPLPKKDKDEPQPSDPPAEPKKLGGSRGGHGNQPEPPAPPVAAGRAKYTVLPGDNFERIAKKLYGRGSLRTELMRVNSTVDPGRMMVGSEIDLLTASEVEKLLGKKIPVNPGGGSAAAGGRTYTVQSGDTLGHISSRELGTAKRVDEILALNPGVDPTAMPIGLVLKLPAR